MTIREGSTNSISISTDSAPIEIVMHISDIVAEAGERPIAPVISIIRRDDVRIVCDERARAFLIACLFVIVSLSSI